MMNEIIYMILALIAGLVLGTLFFGGLWYTVKKAVTATHPALWIISGFIFRVSITLIGFYYVSMGNWQRLVVCVIGFITARIIILRVTKSSVQKSKQMEINIHHEA